MMHVELGTELVRSLPREAAGAYRLGLTVIRHGGVPRLEVRHLPSTHRFGQK